MHNFVPDMYQKSIYAIDYKNLKKIGIKCLCFDLDNTLAPPMVHTPTTNCINLIEELIDMGFKVIIISNNTKKRIAPFKDGLKLDSMPLAFKPSGRPYKRILSKYGFDESEVAVIGDQLLTDIFGGNRMGITTILVNPKSRIDETTTKIIRPIERRVMKYLTKRGLFKLGRYYE